MAKSIIYPNQWTTLAKIKSIPVHTSLEPFPWSNYTMKTIVKQWIRQARVLVDNVAHKGPELGPDNQSISTECSSGTPIQMVLTGLYPFCYTFATFFLGQF